MRPSWQDPDPSESTVNATVNATVNSTGPTAAEQTLRLVARLAEPEGLNERVLHKLAVARAEAPGRSFWSLWLPMQRVQYAAAALLVIAVAGSTWGVYRTAPASNLPVENKPATQSAPSAGFGSAGAERRPATIAPIKVPPRGQKLDSSSTSHHQKPSPVKAAIKPAPKPAHKAVEDGAAVSSAQSSLPRP